jgi:hypothetical protein
MDGSTGGNVAAWETGIHQLQFFWFEKGGCIVRDMNTSLLFSLYFLHLPARSSATALVCNNNKMIHSLVSRGAFVCVVFIPTRTLKFKTSSRPCTPGMRVLHMDVPCRRMCQCP